MCYNNKTLVSLMVFFILLSQMSADRQSKFQPRRPRLINGYTCETTKFPYYVIIRHRNPCGGALIAYSWVLTAAQCLMPENFKNVIATVHSGHDMQPELKQVRKVKKIHRHPNYDRVALYNFNDFRYDIGLILVDEPFNQTAVTHVATLPGPGFTKQCNQVILPGIGKTSNDEVWKTPVEQRTLKCVNLNIVESNTCRNYYAPVVQFDTTHIICTYAPQGTEGTCKGDSGGPLVCDGVVIGTASGRGLCEPKTRPEFYAMVEKYLDFIDHLAKLNGIDIRYSSTNGTGGGDQKPSDTLPANTNNENAHTNGTSARGKNASDESPVNIVQGRVPNWKLVLLLSCISFFYTVEDWFNKGF